MLLNEKKTIGKTVIQATKVNHFSSPPSRTVSYHFTTIEMVSVLIFVFCKVLPYPAESNLSLVPSRSAVV